MEIGDSLAEGGLRETHVNGLYVGLYPICLLVRAVSSGLSNDSIL